MFVRPLSTSLLSTITLALSLSVGGAGCSAEQTETDDANASGAYGGEEAEEGTSSEGALTAKHTVEAFTPAVASFAVARESKALLPLDVALTAGSVLTQVRTLRFDGVEAALVVADGSLRSFVVRRSDLSAQPVADSDYVKALRAKAGAALSSFAGEGGTDLDVALTVDMCQSSKPWDKALFDWVVKAGEARGKPLAVGVAMTGGWAKAHPTELAQLFAWEKTGKLDIVWVNHSFTHPLNCNPAKTSCAFLTAQSVDFRSEVTKNEELLLGQGEVPSALFRFPGLIHDERRRGELSALGLFALDGDAWLAKGQKTHDGAVILVHGNGNEPAGIRLFLGQVDREAWSTGITRQKIDLVSPLRAIAKSAR